MELALYHPTDGYYTRPGMSTGRRADFSTSSDVSPAFGRRIAVQLAQFQEMLGGEGWRLVELGPGRGLLMTDLLDGLARHATRALETLTEVLLVERSPSLRALQHEQLAEAVVPLRWVASLAELGEKSLRGVIIGNEFLDALAVRLVVRREYGRLVERVVTVDSNGALRLEDGDEVPERLAHLVERYGLCPEIGDSAELCLVIEQVIAQIDRVLEAGAALFIDYGMSAEELAAPSHAAGTLVGYYEQRVVLDPLARPGRQDLTAHVNWSQLKELAQEVGLRFAGQTAQDRFLLALGLAEDMIAPQPPAQESLMELEERLAARSLMMPGAGGGKRFDVIAFTRGIEGEMAGFQRSFPCSRSSE